MPGGGRRDLAGRSDDAAGRFDDLVRSRAGRPHQRHVVCDFLAGRQKVAKTAAPRRKRGPAGSRSPSIDYKKKAPDLVDSAPQNLSGLRPQFRPDKLGDEVAPSWRRGSSLATHMVEALPLAALVLDRFAPGRVGVAGSSWSPPSGPR
ncbi:hypothetical protein ABEG18_08805 [Alsobacter sp. KACC 23698]|uniref:Transposase n=1 Tax=Alsobacter sp. KACC 23698 TaxID=3149229 RepID=A0AAU7JLM1_9HYPH